MTTHEKAEMTVAEAYRIHRNAARNVGRGRGYTAQGLDEALQVLGKFWAETGTGIYVTRAMVEEYDKRQSE
jgi:hypothetical protein